MAFVSQAINPGIGNPNRSGIGEIRLTFSVPTTVTDAESLQITNNDDESIVDMSAATLSGNGTTEIKWVTTGVTFADGNYRAILLASESAQLTEDVNFRFHKLVGDVNGDREVNGSFPASGDYMEVNTYFNTSGDPYCRGDANGDGSVNFNDFFAIDDSFGNTITTPVIHGVATLGFGNGLYSPGVNRLPTLGYEIGSSGLAPFDTENIELRGVESFFHDVEGVGDQHFPVFGNSADFLKIERDR